ncbi:hypothetical protein V6U90_30985 [Micromonospora sp. CPCC 206060]|uniref:hypothetical protein n=1 Tax=Micromonospora sp. CPCC 206060 TaxID=3122406 RepID=UPI002FF0C500
MTTYEAGAAAVDILLAGAAVFVIGCAAWVAIHSRRVSTVRLFGRAMHHPRLWAAGAAFMGFSVLLRLGNLTEVTPSAWRTPVRWAGAVLFLAAFALMVASSVLEERVRRRAGHRGRGEPARRHAAPARPAASRGGQPPGRAGPRAVAERIRSTSTRTTSCRTVVDERQAVPAAVVDSGCRKTRPTRSVVCCA